VDAAGPAARAPAALTSKAMHPCGIHVVISLARPGGYVMREAHGI
jgi:hypothetical protein